MRDGKEHMEFIARQEFEDRISTLVTKDELKDALADTKVEIIDVLDGRMNRSFFDHGMTTRRLITDAKIEVLGVMKRSIAEAIEPLATKKDLESLATKKDLESFATKQDLESLATKKELEALATKKDLEGLATKDELHKLGVRVEQAHEGIKILVDGHKGIDQKLDAILAEMRGKFNEHQSRLDSLDAWRYRLEQPASSS
jgi:hypothetical protein